MFSRKWELILRVTLTGAIGITSFIGDQGLKNGKSASIRALADNLTHATVGGLTWMLILILSKKSIVKNVSSIFLCFCMSSFIDVDHFIAAGSWNIHDATHLKKRPFLHCTTLPIVTWFVLILSSIQFNQPNLSDYSWMILASFLSHHIRDGTRRGLWFCPFGSTTPIPYHLYISLSMALPYILQCLMGFYPEGIKVYDNAVTIDVV